MKYLYFLFFVLLTPNISLAQKGNIQTTKPYSISNIKLGMSIDDFLEYYPDNIRGRDTNNSTENIVYNSIFINKIEVTDVVTIFFEKKLIFLSFYSNGNSIHNGLSAKYGYDFENEHQNYEKGVEMTYGRYDKQNDSYLLFRTKYKNNDCQLFIMQDLKAMKLSQSEGF